MLALASLILVVVAMTPSLAHALELPGKQLQRQGWQAILGNFAQHVEGGAA